MLLLWFLFSLFWSRPWAMQINFHYTDSICMNDREVQHHCLLVSGKSIENGDPLQVVPYCLTECPDRWKMNTNTDQPHFTFEQLAQRHITSEQMYQWSAPIDLVENYQLYLNEFQCSPTNQKINNDVFYNCTWPRFGARCEYSFDHLSAFPSNYAPTSLNELVFDYYSVFADPMPTVTCYEHLQCNRGPSPICLDWTEICNGRIDCLDGGHDENDCWQLEMNECDEDEFRCDNGQCIPKEFYGDNVAFPDCLDKSDERGIPSPVRPDCDQSEPLFNCEEITCLDDIRKSVSLPSSSCQGDRSIFLLNALRAAQPNDTSDDCWAAIIQSTNFLSMHRTYIDPFCRGRRCRDVIRETCTKPFYLLPHAAPFYSHLQFLYTKDYLVHANEGGAPEYVCLSDQFCPMLPVTNRSFQFDQIICHHTENLDIEFHDPAPKVWLAKYFSPTVFRYRSCALLPISYFDYCNDHPELYRCMNTSKCISKHRLLDRMNDCFYGDDEDIKIVENLFDLNDEKLFHRCRFSNKTIRRRHVADQICDCLGSDSECEDEHSDRQYSQRHISFQTTCDGFQNLKAQMIDGELMTDETHCEEWLCDNIYTRCDKVWNCLDGHDEVHCNHSLPKHCSTDHRLCVSSATTQLVCLPREKVNDGQIDCLGATDERLLCRSHHYQLQADQFHCMVENYTACLSFLMISCDGFSYCSDSDDKRFCGQNHTDDVLHYFQHLSSTQSKKPIVHFSLVNQRVLEKDPTNQEKPSFSFNEHFQSYENHCHRGLNLRVWQNETSIACLCPPNFYGNQCQYQNERISLTVQFRALSDSWQTAFAAIVLLIDHTEQRSIHAAHQWTYLPSRDCQLKFNLNLLYSTRPKNESMKYFLHIDLYEKVTHTYRSSWLVPIAFSFLPVYRLALLLEIPRIKEKKDYFCSDLKCGSHGRCIRYADVDRSDEIRSFCQCDRGWSGRYCHIPKPCSCSRQSLCLGNLVDHHRSVCLCPVSTFGPRCLIENRVCQTHQTESQCLNGGQCIPNDEYQRRTKPYVCLCPKGFTGERCEQKQTQIILSFHSKIELPEFMLVHFIRYYHDRPHENATTYRSISVQQRSISIFWPQPFHLIFVEFIPLQYYLAVMRPVFNRSEMVIEKFIQRSNRCPHIGDLLNSTVIQFHLRRRIKYYHLPCQSKKPLISCFYDENHLCLCQSSDGSTSEQREANCFEFVHQKKFDCAGQNGCENGAQCFQDNPSCPQTSICICPTCFFGRRCQFSTNGFRLSLDAILGYHIQPYLHMRQQPTLIHVSFAFTILITCVGLIDGVFALITFKSKKIRQIGCGHYLLASSITTLLTMSLFLSKFVILYMAQNRSITSLWFLRIQCASWDYLLKLCLNLDQWFNACISLERAMTTVQGVRFNRNSSRAQAKYAILFLIVFAASSTVYDPIYRHLITENNDKYDEDRTWCIVSYPSWLRTVDAFVHMLHFCAPFLINLISAGIIIWRSAQRRSNARAEASFKRILEQQLREHKHILIAPLVIIILSIPRLILAIVPGCMKSNRRANIYLAGYMISFTPPILTFVIFVLPSKIYKTEFQQSIRQYGQLFAGSAGTARRLLSTRRARQL